MSGRSAVLAAVAWAAVVGSVACADAPGEDARESPANGAAEEHPSADAPAEEPTTPYHWDRGRSRAFVSARLDGGAVARAQVHVGYGRPFWSWVGIEAHALTTTEFGAGYVGVRASAPVIEATAGVRFDAAYRRGPLGAGPRYADADLEAGDAPSRYRALDLDLYGVAPLGPLFVPVEFAATRVLGGSPRYEEWHRVVATRWLFAVRAAALGAFGPGRGHRLGGLGEWLKDGSRDAVTVRVGVAYQRVFTPAVDLYLVATLPVRSPDALSAWNDLYGTATLRWRFATGDSPRVRLPRLAARREGTAATSEPAVRIRPPS